MFWNLICLLVLVDGVFRNAPAENQGNGEHILQQAKPKTRVSKYVVWPRFVRWPGRWAKCQF